LRSENCLQELFPGKIKIAANIGRAFKVAFETVEETRNIKFVLT
jgi:hypothetical protein